MNIYVSNLGIHIESADLVSFFAPYGEVTSAKVITDKDTGKSLRYGFVEMPDEKAGAEAIKNLNGRVTEGRAMSVKVNTNGAKSNAKKLFIER